MPLIQPIAHRGALAALVVGADLAILSETLPPEDEPFVRAMCVYAMEIAGRRRPGPYRDRDAEQFADRITGTRPCELAARRRAGSIGARRPR